jgi:hypothetical protein
LAIYNDPAGAAARGEFSDTFSHHVPETMTDEMKTLPRQLQPTGPSIAYDPATRLLVVIDRDDSNVFALLNALGYAPAN